MKRRSFLKLLGIAPRSSRTPTGSTSTTNHPRSRTGARAAPTRVTHRRERLD